MPDFISDRRHAALTAEEPQEEPEEAEQRQPEPVRPITLAQAHEVFRRWLGEDYDTDALDAMLAAVAVERFGDGSDPVWLLIVSGSGAAKTETVASLDGIGATVASVITSDAALLSATSQKERAKDATGGLLRKMGARGVLVIKDVTSILSMNRDIRGKVLAALREIYDGRWSRDVGTDGGHTIEWSGRIAVIGAVTTAWDTHHGVTATMGDRFVLVRIDSTTNREAAGRKAIANTGSEERMRKELAQAAAGVLAGVRDGPNIKVTDEETDTLLAAADLVTLARTGVEYAYNGDVTNAHAPEMPTRFAKQLAQIVRGGVAIGMDRADARRLAIRCARDSMPPLRLAIIDDLAAHHRSTPADVRKRIGKPWTTVDRQLKALQMLGVAEVEEDFEEAKEKTRWYYSLAPGISLEAIQPEALRDSLKKHNSFLEQEEKSSPEKSLHALTSPSDKSGEPPLDRSLPSNKSGEGLRSRKDGNHSASSAEASGGSPEFFDLLKKNNPQKEYSLESRYRKEPETREGDKPVSFNSLQKNDFLEEIEEILARHPSYRPWNDRVSGRDPDEDALDEDTDDDLEEDPDDDLDEDISSEERIRRRRAEFRVWE